MKVQALEALKKKIDEEGKKDAAKLKLLEEAGEGASETKSSKFEKLKSKTIAAVKPQVDKLEKREKVKQAEQEKERQATEQEEKAKPAEVTEESDNAEHGDDDESVESVTPENNDKSVDATTAADATATANGSSGKEIQDVVAELLSTLDSANLSNKEQKKVLNALSA